MTGDGLMSGIATRSSDAASSINERIHGESSGNARFLFWLAVIIQFVDVLVLQYDRTTMFYPSIGMYLLLAVLAAIAFRRDSKFVNIKDIFVFLAISAFYVLVPFFISYVPKTIMFANLSVFDWVSFFLAILPIWPIYIGIKEEIPFVHHYLNFWIVFLIFLFVFGFAYDLRAAAVTGIGGRPELLQVGPVFNYLWDETTKVAISFWKSINPTAWVNRAVNASGIPAFYPGYNEQDDEPVGIFIEKIRLADIYNYEGYPVTIWADIKGKSFTEEIFVNSDCYIDKVAKASVDPDQFSFFGLDYRSFSCTFNDLKKGSYSAVISASFNFETWGYVTYTFVDQERKRAYETQGKNINSELKINTMPAAVYTNGPVMLGMGSMTQQPVLVDRVSNSRDTIVGITLADQWTEGKLGQVEEFILMVPQDFELTKCDRGPSDPKTMISSSEEGYDFYSFRREDINVDPRVSFQSITCWVRIKNPSQLLAAGPKVERTFIAKAKYDYKIEKRMGFSVREAGRQ